MQGAQQSLTTKKELASLMKIADVSDVLKENLNLSDDELDDDDNSLNSVERRQRR